MTDVKMQDMKLTDQFAGHLQGMKMQDMKLQIFCKCFILHVTTSKTFAKNVLGNGWG